MFYRRELFLCYHFLFPLNSKEFSHHLKNNRSVLHFEQSLNAIFILANLLMPSQLKKEMRNGDNNHNVATYDDHSVHTAIRRARLNPNAGG